MRPERRRAGDEKRATSLELFFDLVFVFAITQVSHLVLDDLSWRGAGRALLALLVVWWAWNYTAWVTNELDPESGAVRLLLLAVMLACLVLAVAIPDGYAGFVQPRSGLAADSGISIVNTPGLVDSGYRGEVRVILLNTDRERSFDVEPGMRIAQLVVVRVPQVVPTEVAVLPPSERGARGFGSSTP